MKSMKKIILALLVVGIAVNSYAQISVGTKASVLLSSANIEGINDDILNKSIQEGFDVSLFANIPITHNFGIQPEISYNKKGFEVGQGIDLNLFNLDLPIGVSAVTEVDYIQVPVLGRVEIGGEKGGVYFLVGPSVAFATKAEFRTKVNSILDINLTTTELDLSNDNYNRFEFAANLGTGAYLNIGNAKAFAEVKYHHGLSDVLNDPIVDIEVKNRAFGIGAGFQIAF